MDRILIILKKKKKKKKKKNTTPGLNLPILFTGAYFHNIQTCLWYIQQISGERLQDHWSSGL